MLPQADHIAKDGGFTLIEAMVALVILSGSLIGFYDFLSTTLNSAGRIQAAAVAYDRHANALELAKNINPMETPEGTFDVGHYNIHWVAQPIDKVRPSSRYPAGVGWFNIALYHVTLSFPDDHDIAPIDVVKLGYHLTGGPYKMMSSAIGPQGNQQ